MEVQRKLKRTLARGHETRLRAIEVAVVTFRAQASFPQLGGDQFPLEERKAIERDIAPLVNHRVIPSVVFIPDSNTTFSPFPIAL